MGGGRQPKRDIGSRRRVSQIRWKRWEIIHAVIFTLLMIAFCIWVAIWITTHDFD